MNLLELESSEPPSPPSAQGAEVAGETAATGGTRATLFQEKEGISSLIPFTWPVQVGAISRSPLSSAAEGESWSPLTFTRSCVGVQVSSAGASVRLHRGCSKAETASPRQFQPVPNSPTTGHS